VQVAHPEEFAGEVQLAHDMGRFADDPLGFVLYAFPWDTDPALQLVELKSPWREKYGCKYGPDAWACDFLDAVAQEVRTRKFNGRMAVPVVRGAVTSGHGIGKSALTAWLVMWIMSTRPHSQGTVTANTAPQLQTKTWAQLAKWKKICITSHWFEIATGRGMMHMRHKDYPDTWFVSAQTCREENSEAFAGQHAANATSFYIFDEASAIPESIKEVAEGGVTDGEPMMFAFGNPTRNTGWFYETFGKQKHRWITRRIDSRKVQITNKKQIDEWIADYGEDSDFVKIRVRGEPPSASSNQLISRLVVEEAMRRKLGNHQFAFAPVILGVDVAWEGDDRSAVMMRQGLFTKLLGVYRGIDNMTLGGLVEQWWTQYNADGVFVDVGWGTGVIDFLRSIGRQPVPVNFGGASLKPEWKDKRSEMWGDMAKWLADGGALEELPDLVDDLIGPDYFFLPNGQKKLEAKKDMKARGLQSPDLADALALTFAVPIRSRQSAAARERRAAFAKADYNVLG